MITRAFVEEYGNHRMEPEIRSLAEELETRGIPVERFTLKQIERRRLPLSTETLVSGSIPAVLGVLRQLEIPPPEPDDYPACLAHLLHRRLWESTVGRVIEDAHSGLGRPVFVKPKGRLKRFTGSVVAGPEDLWQLERASRSLDVLCAEVVKWQAEWRVFIVRNEIVGICPYAGDASLQIDKQVARDAVHTLERSGHARAGYAIDFGVLAPSGATALIEVNDGFSLGSYGLDRRAYTDLTIARWCEMVSTEYPSPQEV